MKYAGKGQIWRVSERSTVLAVPVVNLSRITWIKDALVSKPRSLIILERPCSAHFDSPKNDLQTS